MKDRKADQLHPDKRARPLAAEKISSNEAVLWSLLFMGCAILVSVLVSKELSAILSFYLLLTFSYSTYLKKVAIVDVIILTTFYLVRIIGGSSASGIISSNWLLTFTGFMFFSLAVSKRYSEIINSIDKEVLDDNRRGYQHADAKSLQVIGIVSSLASIIVLAIYVNDESTRILYANPGLLLLTLPIFLYWVLSMWLKIDRGESVEDPVLYLIKNRDSYLCMLLIISVMLVAASGA